MKRVIIIRGPAGVGKSTISWELRKNLKNAIIFDIDYICGIFGGHPRNASDRELAQKLCYNLSKPFIKKGYDIIIERLFSDPREFENIKKLFGHIGYKFKIFSIESSLERVIHNDQKRSKHKRLGRKHIERLWNYHQDIPIKERGIRINVENKSPEQAVKLIIKKL